MSTHADNTGVTPTDLALVATYATRSDAHDHGLVVLSMGLPYWVLPSGDGYHLLVEADSSPDVAREVTAYARETTSPNSLSDLDNRHAAPGTIALAYLYCIVLAAAFLFQKANEPWSIETFANDNIALFDLAEYWRPATALFLHGDLAHLFGNMAFGTWFLLLASRALGAPIAALTILLGGILGNTLSAGIYYPGPTLSIGASTAVFAALGILVGNGLHHSLKNHTLTNLGSKNGGRCPTRNVTGCARILFRGRGARRERSPLRDRRGTKRSEKKAAESTTLASEASVDQNQNTFRRLQALWDASLAPLAGGLALLALTGAGNANGPGNTDILAHVCGFAIGIPLGIASTMLANRRHWLDNMMLRQ